MILYDTKLSKRNLVKLKKSTSRNVCKKINVSMKSRVIMKTFKIIKSDKIV